MRQPPFYSLRIIGHATSKEQAKTMLAVLRGPGYKPHYHPEARMFFARKWKNKERWSIIKRTLAP